MYDSYMNMKEAKLIEAAMQEGVRKTILDSHRRGLPVYQCIDDYIVAIYPDGRIVKLEKSLPLSQNPKLCNLIRSQL